MIRIATDSAVDFEPAEFEKYRIDCIPLSVNFGEREYKENIDLSKEKFYELLGKTDELPRTAQPSPQVFIELIEEAKEAGDDIIIILLSSGISGTYQSAVGAKNSVDNNERIHVINTKTLCGPHRYMVNKALKMQKEGATTQQIIDEMNHLSENHKSFLIPSDFDFLSRGGRLTPLAAKIAGLIKIVPVMTQTPDGKRLESAGVKRTMKKAVEEAINQFKEMGVNENYLITISHAGVQEVAEKVRKQVQEAFPQTETEIVYLSSAFITQGGPGCIAIQAILK